MKRVFSLLLALLLLAAPFAHAAGFVNDAAAINEACLSVMKLEVKNDMASQMARPAVLWLLMTRRW